MEDWLKWWSGGAKDPGVLLLLVILSRQFQTRSRYSCNLFHRLPWPFWCVAIPQHHIAPRTLPTPDWAPVTNYTHSGVRCCSCQTQAAPSVSSTFLIEMTLGGFDPVLEFSTVTSARSVAPSAGHRTIQLRWTCWRWASTSRSRAPQWIRVVPGGSIIRLADMCSWIRVIIMSTRGSRSMQVCAITEWLLHN